MSHVDEGTLHAYLDGELPPAERGALEAHLAQCATCRASLAEERALLERANTLLGAARPVERPAPPLEQLRRQPQRSPWRVRTSVAWAASIALALGVGYYLRSPNGSDIYGLTTNTRDRTRPESVVVAQNQADAAQHFAAAMGRQDERKAAVATPAPSRAPRAYRGERRTPAPTDVAAVAEKMDTSSANIALRRQVRSAAAPTPNAQLAEPVAAVPPASDSAARRPAPEVRLDGIVITGSAANRSAAADTVSEAAQDRSKWPVITRDAAQSLLGSDPVGLPELTTREIRRSPDTEGMVVVEQELDSGTVIEIFQRAARRPNSRLDSLVEGRYRSGLERERADRLARFVGKLRVEISGPLSADSLNRLLEQVRPLP